MQKEDIKVGSLIKVKNEFILLKTHSRYIVCKEIPIKEYGWYEFRAHSFNKEFNHKFLVTNHEIEFFCLHIFDSIVEDILDNYFGDLMDVVHFKTMQEKFR